jgi:chemotaxis protein MotB
MIKRGLLLAGLVGTLATLTQGCVTYDMYDRKAKEAEANKAAYLGADAAVANARKDADLAKLRCSALEKELAAANQKLANQDTVVAASYSDLKSKYEKMLADLKNEQGEQWTVNPSTGGVVLDESVYFSPGRAELKGEKFAALDALIGKLNSPEFATKIIEVAGHTDTDPIARSGWKDNYQLSSERARAVLVYFQNKGIGPDRIFIAGYGPTRPRSEKKAENRRVEVVLHERT